MGAILTNEKFWTALVVLALIGGGYATRDTWLPAVTGASKPSEQAADGHADDPHAGHDHGAADEGNSVQLSEQAQKSVGLVVEKVESKAFDRTMTVPGLVVERPGRSQVSISSPLTGIVTKIYPLEGVSVAPGEPLFDMLLTHEDLVSAQRDFLRSAEELDVLNREIARLESVGEGVIAGKRILERKYEKQKLEAGMRAQQQALLMHELSEEQVEQILATRELLKGLTVRVPDFPDDDEQGDFTHRFHVQSLTARPGQHVEAGENLCVLADHGALYVEGQAFAEDASRLQKAIRNSENVRLLVGSTEGGRATKEELPIVRVADRVDTSSRALKFYALLPNKILQEQSRGRHNYLGWQFRPGQRVDLLVPVERWENRIVLPVEAVVKDGAESYVFRQNGSHFDRVAVHVEHRGPQHVVIANDGQVFPGERVVVRGAYRLNVEIKNKAGGGIDPHAGHNH